MKMFFCLVIFLSASMANATCVRSATRKGNLNLQTVPSQAGDLCFYMILPYIVENMTYRSYNFASNGEFAVFSSYGQGKTSETTGTKEFAFFPRVQDLQYHFNDELKRLEVQHTNGDTFYFSYETAELLGSGKGSFSVAPLIQLGDQGGVNIINYQGLSLDYGFTMGDPPSLDAQGKAVFRDGANATCPLPNKSFLNYTEEGMSFRYSDSELRTFLATKCPQLQW